MGIHRITFWKWSHRNKLSHVGPWNYCATDNWDTWPDPNVWTSRKWLRFLMFPSVPKQQTFFHIVRPILDIQVCLLLHCPNALILSHLNAICLFIYFWAAISLLMRWIFKETTLQILEFLKHCLSSVIVRASQMCHCTRTDQDNTVMSHEEWGFNWLHPWNDILWHEGQCQGPLAWLAGERGV